MRKYHLKFIKESNITKQLQEDIEFLEKSPIDINAYTSYSERNLELDRLIADK